MELGVAIIFGLCVGSFLNVAIYRLHPDRRDEMSIAIPPRSFCPKCNKQLAWWQNIPVISWIILGGKCRFCKERISIVYPTVELMSGVAAGMCFIRFGLSATSFIIFALVSTLIVISFIDLASKTIPNVITYPGIIFAALLGITAEFTNFLEPPLTSGALNCLVGIFTGSGFLYLVGWGYYAYSKKVGLGGGDIKLLAMTGGILGWESAFPTIILGSISGAVIGIIVMIISKQGRHTEIPFGPWLSLGVVLYIFEFPLHYFFPFYR